MIVDPQIAALRSDPASQRWLRSQMDNAHQAWQSEPVVAPVLRDLDEFAQSGDLGACAHLSKLLGSLEYARDWTDLWLRRFGNVLREAPLAQLPQRHHYADGFANMQIASAGGAALSLSCYEEKDTGVTAQSVVFSDRQMQELVLYGSGEATAFELEAGSISRRSTTLYPGASLVTPNDKSARQINWVRGSMVVLQVSRVPRNPGVTRELSLDDGRLLLQSSGNKRASQTELAISVLSALNRCDAAPTLAELTLAGPDQLRWEALRHSLALDVSVGWGALTAIAMDADDPLHEPAQRLRSQLLATYPQLKEQEAA